MFSKKRLISLGLLLLLAAYGAANSNDFLGRFEYAIRKEAAVGTSIVVAPREFGQPADSYFTLYVQPEAGIAPVLERIKGAQKSLDLVMYLFEDAELVDVLCDAHARGIAVRVLLNGGYYTKDEDRNDATFDALKNCNVSVKWTPTYFALTHQKTLVTDGTEALVMTFNFQAKHYATGRDFAVSNTNPIDVADILKTFNADWEGKSGIAPIGDTLVWSPGSEETLLYLINAATSTLDIYSQVMEDKDIVAALVAAEQRGVEVRLVMTYATNWKPVFIELKNAGVDVRTFASSSKKIYIHAKMIMVDSVQAFIGSENFSENSLNKNRELGLVLSAPHIVSGVKAVFEADWVLARPFTITQ